MAAWSWAATGYRCVGGNGCDYTRPEVTNHKCNLLGWFACRKKKHCAALPSHSCLQPQFCFSVARHPDCEKRHL